jgi:hypothetical protein
LTATPRPWRAPLWPRAELYRSVALALPLVLVGVSRAAPYRWACTVMAVIYAAFFLALLGLLPFFTSDRGVTPVAFGMTQLVPAPFPLLLVGAALLLDLLRRLPPRLGGWREALASGTLFVATFAVVRWPLAQ